MTPHAPSPGDERKPTQTVCAAYRSPIPWGPWPPEARNKGCKIFPQFPTGNGKIDIVIKYKNRVYGIELKSYTDYSGYKSALPRAAMYGKQLELKEVLLVFFLEAIDKRSREKYEKEYLDESTGVKVIPIFVETG